MPTKDNYWPLPNKGGAKREQELGKMEIVCYGLGVIFLGVGLAIALTTFQDAWNANNHVRWLVWGTVASGCALLGIFVGGLPIAYKADAEKPARGDDPAKRAWVLVVDCKFMNLFAEGAPLRSEIVLRNTGQIPAMNVEIINNAGIGELPTEMPIRTPQRKSVMVIAPGQEMAAEVTHTRDRTAEDVTNFRNGPYGAFAFGRITYTDSFNIERQTDYCFFANKQTGEASACDRWNQAK